ncbi:MAG: AAA family ATPase [Bacteroidota bacterium]
MKSSKKIVVGLCGSISSGKSYIAEYLRDKFGFKIIKTREILSDYILSLSKDPTEKNLQDYGVLLMNGSPAEEFCNFICSKLNEQHNYVIDSLRPLSHYNNLKRKIDGFKLLYVLTSEEERMQRFIERKDRANTIAEFRERTSHPVEMEVTNLIFLSDLILTTKNKTTFPDLDSFIFRQIYGDGILYFQQIINCVKEFHKKFNYDIGTGSIQNISFIVGLMLEELSEIHQCLTKGEGDLAEEHADLLYFLLGSCISLNLNVEEAFMEKHEKNMKKVLVKNKNVERPKQSE